uniref:Proteasome assembly chaperone 3 n=1 Tax=Phaeomonas parva TaxID=124430 RepID=A0A7S1TQ84_9STRA|mmetsp:Transcript_12795/g.38401  ORF Transcript_12795/g.38401 Transcript_12795/m.38401 type:complete len:139 (+) Transcript_12795:89-505(+)
MEGSTLMAGAPAAPSVPVVMPQTRRKVVDIGGIETEIVVQGFQDAIFVVITQLKKLGTLIMTHIERGRTGKCLFDARVLLGKRDDPLLVLYARQIAEQISTRTTYDRNVVLSIALKEDGRGPAAFQETINHVLDLPVW